MGRTVLGRSYFLSLEHSLWGRQHMHSSSEIRSDYRKVTKWVWVWPRLGTPVLVSSISWRLVFRSSPQLESFWVTVSLFSLQIYERKTLQAFLSCEHVFKKEFRRTAVNVHLLYSGVFACFFLLKYYKELNKRCVVIKEELSANSCTLESNHHLTCTVWRLRVPLPPCWDVSS